MNSARLSAQEIIPWPDAGRLDSHEDLTFGGYGDGELFQSKDIRWTERMDANRAHVSILD